MLAQRGLADVNRRKKDKGFVLLPILALAGIVVPTLIITYALGTAQQSQVRVIKDEYYNRSRFQLNGIVQRAIPVVLRDSGFSSCAENSDCKSTLQAGLSNTGIALCSSNISEPCLSSITRKSSNQLQILAQVSQSYLGTTGTWTLSSLIEYQTGNRNFSINSPGASKLINLIPLDFTCTTDTSITPNTINCPSASSVNLLQVNNTSTGSISLQDLKISQGTVVVNFCGSTSGNVLSLTNASSQALQNGRLFITSICPSSSALDIKISTSVNTNISVIAPESTVTISGSGTRRGYFYAKRFSFLGSAASNQILGSLASLATPTAITSLTTATITPSKDFDAAANQFFSGILISNNGFTSSDSASCSAGQVKVYVAGTAGTPSASPSCQTGSIAPSTPSLPQVSGGSGTPKFTRILKTALSPL